jgi:hypothetical protein
MESEVKKLLDKENYMIGIPSRGRERLLQKRLGVWKHIDPKKEDYPTVLIVREEETNSYRDTGYMGELIRTSNDSTIANKRDELIQYAIKKDKKYLIMIDDDATMYYREENLSSKYTCLHEKFVKDDCFNKMLLESISLCDEEYPVTGFPIKQGSQGIKCMFSKNRPMHVFVCFHVPTLAKEGIRADGLEAPFMEDRYVLLSLLKKGYKSLSNARFCVGDYGTAYRGGSSLTRNIDNQSETAKKLQKVFPESVELKWKENGTWNERRLDCAIDYRYYLKEGETNFIEAKEGLEKLKSKGVL